MFLSLKKQLDGSSRELVSALSHLCQTLLRCVRLQVVRGEETEVKRFQGTILALETRICATRQVDEILAITGEAVKALEDYSQSTNHYLKLQREEMATMICMLTSTFTAPVDAGGAIEPFHPEEEASHLEPLAPDTATSLPSRADAEYALVQARDCRNMYAAVLPVDRLGLIESRFGPQSRDLVVKFFADYLITHLLKQDQLFRWNESAFLVLVERPQPRDTVRADLSRFASAKLELAINHYGREILVPVSSTWTLFSASEGLSLDVLTGKIDKFLKSEMHFKESF